MTEPENHTLTLLREMRAEQDAFRQQVFARFDQMQARLDAMHQNGMKALKGFVGHRAMVERTMASFEIDMIEVKQRIGNLEAVRP